MTRRTWLSIILMSLLNALLPTSISCAKLYATKSGIMPWVDPDTPDSAQTYTNSRGETWTLTMSDEFNTAGRSFDAGEDHIWVSIEMPDGTNSALQYYSHNMTSTVCDGDDTCYFQIEINLDETNVTVWNSYMSPPGYQDVAFYYRSGTVQSWNKFCYQGGAIKVKAQLPGAVTRKSGNPDVKTGSLSVRAATTAYYPTWPGIWMMGNLGRALYTASTSRLWPFTYSECNESVFDSQNQRISACDDDPGHGLNPNQGRGAPEIDILEGAGTAISTSIQVGPGMPEEFRRMPDTTALAGSCIYSYSCKAKGANHPDVPTTYYSSLRGHKTWYQGLRYGANNLCDIDNSLVQSYKTVAASLEAGITENVCTLALCPAPYDVNADLDFINGTTEHWGINTNGTCFPKMNPYAGAYLCSAGHTGSECGTTSGSTSAGSEFSYQMDAISADWEVHMAAYLDWVVYTLEWVMGDDGYVRWEVEGQPVFEVPAEALTNPPQDASQMNPKKIMIEEPMYLIINVALSSTWGSSPPNAGGDCYGDGSDSQTNAICDSFPMYMKIDYIRLYQDTSDGTSMAIGCDPSTHPTAQWIKDHIDDYTDSNNPDTDVSGMGFCANNDDCTIDGTVITGTCSSGRCKCKSSSWKGPRCTVASTSTSTDSTSDSEYGPPMYTSIILAGVTVVTTTGSMYMSIVATRKQDAAARKNILTQQQQLARPSKNFDGLTVASIDGGKPVDNYSTNFV